MTDVVLALLEERACTLTELAIACQMSRQAMRAICRELAAERKIHHKVGNTWALTPVNGELSREIPRQAAPANQQGGPADPPPRKRRGRPPIVRARVDTYLDIYAPKSGVAICAAPGCGKRFDPEREGQQFCSSECKSGPKTSQVRTVVIDGIEYEATSVGRTPLAGEAVGLGSTLSGRNFRVAIR